MLENFVGFGARTDRVTFGLTCVVVVVMIVYDLNFGLLLAFVGTTSA